MKKSFFLFSIIFFCITSFSQEIDISLKLDKGSSYKLSSTSNTSIQQQVNGQLMEIEMKVEGEIDFFVSDIIEDEYIMLVKYDKLTMENTAMERTMKYSSESENEFDLMSKLMANMTSKAFNCNMKKNGSISHISGLEELYVNIIDSIPEASQTDKEQLLKQIEKAYGNKAFKNSFGMSTHIFPDSNVSMGESWYINTQLGGMFTKDLECSYVFYKNTEDHYKILGSAWIEKDKVEARKMNGMDTEFQLEGEYSSEITINKETGWIITSKSEYFMKGDIIIIPNAQIPDGMKIPFKLNNRGYLKSN